MADVPNTTNPAPPKLTKAQRKARKEKTRGERTGPEGVICIWPDAVTVVIDPGDKDG